MDFQEKGPAQGMDPDQMAARIAYLEENRRFVQGAIEMALSLGDFQREINQRHPPDLIFRETERRIQRLIGFEARGFYTVDPETSDLTLSLCEPEDMTGRLEEQMAFLIDRGFVAWAIREQGGVFILSRDKTRYLLLHNIATHSRLRGMFVGMFHSRETAAKDISLDLLSVILRNAANAMESIEYCRLLNDRNRLLESDVQRKTEEVVRYERRLRRAQKMEAIGNLAGGVAHDLNNILTGIVSYPDLILFQLPEDSPLRKPLATIKASGKKAAAIVQDLLTMARRGVPVAEAANLNTIIAEYLRSPEFDTLITHHPKVRVHTRLESDLLNISGSLADLSKTVMNLMSNAVEAMPDGGDLSIETENRHVGSPVTGYDRIVEGDYVVLRIADTGIGISREDQERIFEPFYGKKVMGRSSTGLGMAVVWGTVKDHNGYIDLESAEGQGTVIQLYFPATRQTPVFQGDGSMVENYRGKGEQVLVVDDAELQREIADMILTRLGYSVATAASGEEAVAALEKGPVDLVVLDMIMGEGMDGLDTYRRILELHPGQRAIIASGYSATERVKAAQDLGVGQYLKKPYTIDRLGMAVRAELDK